jgi:hypothetical protein
MTQTGWRRAVVEDVSKMAFAAGAQNLGADHAVSSVGVCDDVFFRDAPKEARPASP